MIDNATKLAEGGDFLAFLKHRFLGATLEDAARAAGCPGYETRPTSAQLQQLMEALRVEMEQSIDEVLDKLKPSIAALASEQRTAAEATAAAIKAKYGPDVDF